MGEYGPQAFPERTLYGILSGFAAYLASPDQELRFHNFHLCFHGAGKGELQSAKRRLEKKEVEEQNKRGCGEYYFLEVRTRLERRPRPPGVRATIYEIADQHNALQYTNEPAFARSKRTQF
jgi:hypothetical protein